MKLGFNKENLELFLISEIQNIEKEYLETTSIENVEYHSSKIWFMKRLVSRFKLNPNITTKLNDLQKREAV